MVAFPGALHSRKSKRDGLHRDLWNASSFHTFIHLSYLYRSLTMHKYFIRFIKKGKDSPTSKSSECSKYLDAQTNHCDTAF